MSNTVSNSLFEPDPSFAAGWFVDDSSLTKRLMDQRALHLAGLFRLSCADHQNVSRNQKASKEYAEARHLPEAIVHLMLYHQELVIVASVCIIRRRRPEEDDLRGRPNSFDQSLSRSLARSSPSL
jgi:hypothetical protein